MPQRLGRPLQRGVQLDQTGVDGLVEGCRGGRRLDVGRGVGRPPDRRCHGAEGQHTGPHGIVGVAQQRIGRVHYGHVGQHRPSARRHGRPEQFEPVVDHVAAQVVPDRVGVPFRLGEQAQHPVWRPVAGLLGQLPARPGFHIGEHAEQPGPGGQPRLGPPESASDPGERRVEHFHPGVGVYDGLCGHRAVVSVHNRRLLCGGRFHARITRDLYLIVTTRYGRTSSDTVRR